MMQCYVQVLNDEAQVVADLDKATDIQFRLVANEAGSARFMLPADDPKREYCKERTWVRIYDGLRWVGPFRIVPRQQRRRRDAPYETYECEHALASLNDDMLVGVHNCGIGTVEALEYILAHQDYTRWTLGDVELTRGLWHRFKNKTLLEALLRVCREVGDYWLDLQTTHFPWTLNVRQLPEGVTAELRYTHNLQGVEREIDARELCTRLYVYGHGEEADQLNLSHRDITSGTQITLDGTTYTIHRGDDPPGDTGMVWLDTSEHVHEAYWGVRWPYRWRLWDSEEGEWKQVHPADEELEPLLAPEYLEAETIGQYGAITRVWEDQRYRNEQSLLEAAQDRLDKVSKPATRYSVDVVDVAQFSDLPEQELRVARKVRVIDEELGIDTHEHITALRRTGVGSERERTQIEIGEIERFPSMGDVAFADDLDEVSAPGAFGRVLSTQIEAGKIKLSAVEGGTLGPFPATPSVAGLYLGATHHGFHDGNNWRTFMDIDGRMMATHPLSDHRFDWDPMREDPLEIVGKMVLRPGSTGYEFLADAPVGVTRSFWQDTPPDPEAVEIDEDDIWFDTSAGNRAHYWGWDEQAEEYAWLDGQDHDIAQALQDALQAYDLADEKVKTWFQATAPDPNAVNLTVGDLWVNIGDHNKVHRWSGSAWNKVTGDVAALDIIGSAYIEQLAVKEGHIQSCSIDSLTAGSLDAGTIRLKGGDIRSDNFSAGSTGWRIRHNGLAEFSQVTIRGTMAAGEINFHSVGRQGLSVIRQEIASGAVGSGQIGYDEVNSHHIGWANLDGWVLKDNTVAEAKIQQITAAKINVDSLDALSVNAGLITSGEFRGCVFRTGTSGQRVEIGPGAWGDRLIAYDNWGNPDVQVGGDGVYFFGVRHHAPTFRTPVSARLGVINVDIYGTPGHLRVYSGHHV